jgi:hypothetical protein
LWLQLLSIPNLLLLLLPHCAGAQVQGAGPRNAYRHQPRLTQRAHPQLLRRHTQVGGLKSNLVVQLAAATLQQVLLLASASVLVQEAPTCKHPPQAGPPQRVVAMTNTDASAALR